MNPNSLPADTKQTPEPVVNTMMEFQNRVIAFTDRGLYELRGNEFVKMKFKEE